MSRVVFFEISTPTPEITMRFFKKVFGWEFSRFNAKDYWLMKTGEDHVPGINGGIKANSIHQVNNVIEVDSLKQLIPKIKRHNGKIFTIKESMHFGKLLYFQTPDKINMAAIEINKPI